MSIIKKFDEFLDESHWSEMNRRSQGIAVRKEDVYGNKKMITSLTKKVYDAIGAAGIDLYDSCTLNFKELLSEFFIKCKNRFDLTFDDGEFFGLISFSQKVDIFKYDGYFCHPRGLYLSEGLTCNIHHQKATIWLDFIDKKKEFDRFNVFNPYAFYYIQEIDEWRCNEPYMNKNLEDVEDGEWIKKLISIITPIVNPDTKYNNK